MLPRVVSSRGVLTFLGSVFRGFRRNQGMLLAGAVAYYTLLAVVPLLALLLVALSHVVDPQTLLATLRENLELVLPAHADDLSQQVGAVLDARDVVGGVGFLVLLFFSATAFTVLENAMSVIFFHRVAVKRRHFAISAVIPFAFISLLGAGLVLITFISGALQAVGRRTVTLFGVPFSLSGLSHALLYTLGVSGLVCIFTAIYLVMPVGRIAFRHALIGGVTATLLWEICRHVLVWYFATLSMVNVVYGSLATSVVALLSFEIAAVILLFGAQVIAEFERSRAPATEGPDHGFQT
jgi:membrane protein